ncbi:hypothetical protein KY333_00725 [Candidatus Woesearchaeota archaeon]|nr:hypothetical protein [Candidatus Woesearchaeota archaeon]MBW2993798.1 hypothetical protein [Candidatus Woesearchaeota archaeon]
MADRQLVNYIKSQLKAGYTSNQIRIDLIKRGHAAGRVDAAIDESETGKFPHILLWGGIIAIVILIIILSSIVYVKMQAREELLTEPPEEKIIKESVQEKLPLSEQKETTIEQQMQEERERKTETKIFQATEEIEQAKQASLTDTDRAERICTDLLTRQEKDACFLTIAKSAEKSTMCDKISPGATKDQCYFSFAVLGQNTCDKISDELVKRNCEQLISLKLPLK